MTADLRRWQNVQVCDSCWVEQSDRTPVRMTEVFRETETCALCGRVTRSGIYKRLLIDGQVPR